MDEDHLFHAARYVSLNPVRAGLVRRAQDWKWSSAGAHIAGGDDGLAKVAPFAKRYGDIAAFLEPGSQDAEEPKLLRSAKTTGQPLGSGKWLKALERQTGRVLRPQKHGPKGKHGNN
jgi:putative transposase